MEEEEFIKALKRKAVVGDWAVCFLQNLEFVLVAQIVEIVKGGYKMDRDWLRSRYWSDQYCLTFSTEEEAREYSKSFDL